MLSYSVDDEADSSRANSVVCNSIILKCRSTFGKRYCETVLGGTHAGVFLDGNIKRTDILSHIKAGD